MILAPGLKLGGEREEERLEARPGDPSRDGDGRAGWRGGGGRVGGAAVRAKESLVTGSAGAAENNESCVIVAAWRCNPNGLQHLCGGEHAKKYLTFWLLWYLFSIAIPGTVGAKHVCPLLDTYLTAIVTNSIAYMARY